MSTPTLVDSDVRRRAETEVGTSFAMSAGAGTGKTTVLVRRLVEHLLAGTEPRQLAAITFTEKAAGELSLRARDALEARLVEARSEDEIARLERILARFGDLTLSTIHSFCLNLLEREALDAAWAPDTEILESGGSGAIDATFRAWRAGLDVRHPDLSILLREGAAADVPGQYGGSSLLSTARAMLDNRDLKPLRADASAMDWSAAWRELQELADNLASAFKQGRNPACKLLAKARPLVETVNEVARRPGAEVSVREALTLKPTKLGGVGSAKDFPPGGKQALVQAAVDFAVFQDRWRREIGIELHRIVVQDLLEHFVPAVGLAKRDAAQADFADLLFQAAALLTGRPDARRRLAERFEVILIDEVQDTDPIQAEVALLLTRPSEATGAWNAVPPRPGSLFAVGDPKQSIYRFRRADVETWKELLAVVQRSGAQLSLRQNFRSVPGIVAWVNHAFANYPDYEPLVPHRDPLELDPVVVVHTGLGPAKDGRNTDGLIRHLSELRANGAQVFDKALGALRPLRWSDVMILLPSWTLAEAIQDELNAARIDSVVEGGSKFFERDEVRLLLDAMRAIDEPQDGAAVVAVLRGLFGVSLEELARFRKAGGSWNTTTVDPPPGAIADAFRLLRHLNSQRSRLGWVPLLDDLLDQTRATCVFALTPRRWGILANLDKLKAMIYDLEPTARSPREVITALEAAREARTEDLSVLDTDLDAVRITTIFKAKGLEAPVVALIHTERKVFSPDIVVRRDARQVALRAGSELVPPGWDAMEQEEREELSAERRRWMYVATTRARDQLILCHPTPPPADQREAWLEKDVNLVGPDLFHSMGPFDLAAHDTRHTIAPGVVVRLRQRDALPEVPRVTETFPGLDHAVDPLLVNPPTVGDPDGESRQQALREARKRAERGSTRWRAVGSLTERADQRSQHKGGGVGPVGGTVVHRVMEHLDLGRPVDELRPQVHGLVHAFATLEGLPVDLEEVCETIVQDLLNNPILDKARQAPERWREVPFTFPERGVVIAGTIDLCFPVNAERTEWVVVDWKSHLPAIGDPVRAKYERQLAWYVRALLQAVTPCTHVSPYLVGPHPALGLVDPLAETLAEISPALHGLVEGLARRGLVPTPGHEAPTGPDTYVELEVAWAEQMVGIGLDLPDTDLKALADFGWSIESADTGSATWPERASEGVLSRLGLTADDLEGDA